MKAGVKILSTLLLTFVAMSSWAIAGVKISVVPESLKPGDKGIIKVVMTIPQDMHQTYIPGENDYFYLNADNPNLSLGTTVYPTPQEKKEGNEWVYKGTLIVTKPFTVSKTAKPGQIKVNTEFAYNICFETGSCEPPETVNKALALTITGAGSVNAPVKGTATGNDNAPIKGTATGNDNAPVKGTTTGNDNAPVKGTTTGNDNAPIKGTATNTAVAGDEVILPATGTTVVDDTPVKGAATSANTGNRNIWELLIMAFLGGIILNIMPCVLPVLSIKAMSIVKQAHEDKKQIMRHSFAYTLGILASFIIMAAVIIAIKLTGEAVGWGFQFQNTGFVIFLTSLIFIFALSLFDVFIIQVPGMTAATKAGSQGGTHGSFFSGIFAVLLATPCSAPMLGTALGFAFSQTPVMILLFFIVIGLGLAMPFILLGFNPRLMKLIPKPGEWMNIFKEIMGFLLIATVVWLLNVVFQQNGGEYLIRVLSYLVFQGFAVWLYGRFVRAEHTQATQWIFSILAIVIIAASVMIILPGRVKTPIDGKVQQTSEVKPVAEMAGWEGWQTFSPKLVEDLVAQGKPVFVDFGAKWCMTCISNEKTVILTDAMQEAFKTKKVQLVHGDFTKKNPEMQAFMKKFDRAGVPFYVLYVPGKEPKPFPEIVTLAMIKSALEDIK